MTSNGMEQATKTLRIRITDTLTIAREKVIEITVPADADVGDDEVRDAAIKAAENDGVAWDEDQVDNTPYEVEDASGTPITSEAAAAANHVVLVGGDVAFGPFNAERARSWIAGNPEMNENDRHDARVVLLRNPDGGLVLDAGLAS